jgi:hypothetical protein
MRWLLIALLAWSTAPARAHQAPDPDRGCLLDHVTKAHALNFAREPKYEKWAEEAGLFWFQSFVVSQTLMGAELVSEHQATEVDRQALPFQEAGIPIVCKDLAHIDPDRLDPDQIPHTVIRPPEKIPALFGQESQRKWADELRQAYDRDLALGTSAFPETLVKARALREKLSKVPGYFCIGRHLVESIIRIAALAPGYVKAAEENGLEESPLSISKSLLESHFTLLGTTYGLDRMAAEVQRAGVPIICHDVPPILDPDQP